MAKYKIVLISGDVLCVDGAPVNFENDDTEFCVVVEVSANGSWIPMFKARWSNVLYIQQVDDEASTPDRNE